MNALHATAPAFPEVGRLQTFLEQALRPSEFSSIRARAGQGFPLINVGSTSDAVEVMALAPGIDPKKIQLTLDKGLLVIAGERENGLPQAEGANLYANERFAGAFRRVVSLPDDVDPNNVRARYRDGILRVTLGKRESSRPRHIEVN